MEKIKTIILIASYKRPECVTAKTLENAGYCGEWAIVADDTDDTDYESLYPEHVVRFCKAEYAEKVDTADNFHEMCTAVYAYNFCIDYARDNGYEVFGLFDDDITGFIYRYIDGNKLRSKKVTRLTEVFNAYCRFVHDSGIVCGTFVKSGRLIGGKGNPIVSRGTYYNPTNTYIINAHADQSREYPFVGTFWEDSTYNYLNNMTGHISLAFMPITATMIEVEAMNEGGCTPMYEKTTSYIRESYSNMIVPGFFKWKAGCKGCVLSGNIPRILNENWRKERA